MLGQPQTTTPYVPGSGLGGGLPAPGLQRQNAAFKPISRDTGQTGSTTPGASLFGQQPTPAGTSSLFGQQPGATATQGAQQPGGLFGATPQPAATSTGLFGSVGGATAASTGIFGATTPQATGTQGGGLFGNNPATTTTSTGASIFGGGQPQQPASNTLFGQQPVAGAQQTTSLFGQAPKPAAQGTSIFGGTFGTGQPQATQNTIGGAPAQTSLFGGQQNTAGPGAGFQQQQPQQQQHGGQMFIGYLEAATRAVPLKELSSTCLTLPLSNQYRRKLMNNLPGGEQTFAVTKQIDDTLENQEKDLAEIMKQMTILKKETVELRSSVLEVSNQTQGQCRKVSAMKLQIQAMEADLWKNMSYHSQLEATIDQFNDPDRMIEVPFQFFYDLYREQEREVFKLGDKVIQAENLAEKLLQETMEKKRDMDRGSLTDSDLDQVSLRDKIFQVCTMLYELQKKAGLNLAVIESRVSQLRRSFTDVTLAKNHWESRETIDKLFEKAGGLEINGQLRNLQKRNFETKLSAQFDGSMNLVQDTKNDLKAEAKASRPRPMQQQAKQGGSGSLTERLHRGTQASIRMGTRQGTMHSVTDMYPREELYASSRLGKRTSNLYQQSTHVTSQFEDDFYEAPTVRSGIASRRMRITQPMMANNNQYLGGKFSYFDANQRNTDARRGYERQDSMPLYRKQASIDNSNYRFASHNGGFGSHGRDEGRSFTTVASSTNKRSFLGAGSRASNMGDSMQRGSGARNPLF